MSPLIAAQSESSASETGCSCKKCIGIIMAVVPAFYCVPYQLKNICLNYESDVEYLFI